MIYMISLVNTGHAEHLRAAKEILPVTMYQFQQFNWSITLVDAVNGYKLDKSIWNRLGISTPKSSDGSTNKFRDKPGAQGCFLSHFMLWQKCVEINLPIVILEDDAFVIAPLPDIVTHLDCIKLDHAKPKKYNDRIGYWSPGAFAYWVTPNGAKKMIQYAQSYGAGYADKFIASKILNWEYITSPCVRLGPRQGSSTNPKEHPYSFK